MPTRYENKLEIFNLLISEASMNDIEVLEDVITAMTSKDADTHRETYALMVKTFF